jgi:hypothetical protein
LEIIPSAHKTQVKFRSHFSGEKSASYGPGNTVSACSNGDSGEDRASLSERCLKTGYLAWKGDSIRVIRPVLSSTDGKSLALGSVGCFPHLRTNLAKKTLRSAACQNHKSPGTAAVTFHRSPSVICSVDNEPDIDFVHSSYQAGYKGE